MKNVLLIAGLGEAYYFEPFARAGLEEGVQIFVLDPSLFPDQSKINIRMNEVGVVDGYVDVMKYTQHGLEEKVCLDINEINVAWYLRETMHWNKKKKREKIEDKFRHNETNKALKSLYSILKCKWVNRLEVIDFIASNKFYQQLVAVRNGLLVPNTLISNSVDGVTTLAREQGGVLIKAMGYIKLDKDGACFLYSEKFAVEEIVNSPDAIRFCPVFAQHYVEKRYEYRVMVIGSQVLACRIDSQASEKTKIDWRHYDFDLVEHVNVQLPMEIKIRLLNFMKDVGLRYGAIDMIERPDGNFVFLEVNPSGQWGWITNIAKVPVVEAVVSMLKEI